MVLFQGAIAWGFLYWSGNRADPTITGTGFDSCADEDDPSTMSSSWVSWGKYYFISFNLIWWPTRRLFTFRFSRWLANGDQCDQMWFDFVTECDFLEILVITAYFNKPHNYCICTTTLCKYTHIYLSEAAAHRWLCGFPEKGVTGGMLRMIG